MRAVVIGTMRSDQLHRHCGLCRTYLPPRTRAGAQPPAVDVDADGAPRPGCDVSRRQRESGRSRDDVPATPAWRLPVRDITCPPAQQLQTPPLRLPRL